MDNFQDMSVIQTLKFEVSLKDAKSKIFELICGSTIATEFKDHPISNLIFKYLISTILIQFLMCLQKRDFQAANQLQKELQKRCPNDKQIAEFSQYLPEEARAQLLEGKPEQDEEASEYDSEEEDEEISEESEPEEPDSDPEEEEQIKE